MAKTLNRGADRLQRGVSAGQARETGSFGDGKEPWVSWPIMPTLQPPKGTGFPQAVRGRSKATRSSWGQKLRLCRVLEDDGTALLPRVQSWPVLGMKWDVALTRAVQGRLRSRAGKREKITKAMKRC